MKRILLCIALGALIYATVIITLHLLDTQLNNIYSIILAFVCYFISTYIYSLRYLVNVIRVTNIEHVKATNQTNFEALIQFKMKQYTLYGNYTYIPINEITLRSLLFSELKKETNLEHLQHLINKTRYDNLNLQSSKSQSTTITIEGVFQV